MWWVEPRACRHRSRCDHSLLSTESQRSITSPQTQPTLRSGNLKRTFSYLSVNILDYVGINPEGNVLKEDKVAKSRRVCYLTLFNRSDAKWRPNSCRGSFFFFRFRLYGVSHTAIGGVTLHRLRSERHTVSLRTQYCAVCCIRLTVLKTVVGF